MASSILQVRIDEDLRREVNEIFHNLGLDMSSAVRLFFNRVVISQGLPFSMTLENESGNKFDPINYLSQADKVESKNSFDPIDYLNKVD
ncbi:type II toxin-antitoxin system RelB/DinJ family antitoxin [Treponema pectinovorum]|uniref:type II toxin-antitoxin system RelB/DinJ family antitoxin n=1 Tax=Treponema pectinovorum TaxID=164 RepID=UPI0011F20511|nr:type II toxin-antitoxin system RelB/DinJ family antitoxin [Treponema pectinovorum]